ncbi:MAG: hypothetical protein ABIQ52_07990 [Vicinamibacterales bacterium]
MTAGVRVVRWIAIAIATAAAIDPALPWPVRTRATIRVVGERANRGNSVTAQLRTAGFTLADAQEPAAIVLLGNSPRSFYSLPRAAPPASGSAAAPQVWALDTAPAAPNARVVDVMVSPVRVAEHAVAVRVEVEARGLQGTTSEVVLEDAGITVATTRHEWKTPSETWEAELRYLPPGPAGGRVRVRVLDMRGESTRDDNSADLALPAMRGPVRTLVIEAGVTWPGLFVRRAIEGEPAFAVTARQHASAAIATRAGSPPAVLTRDTLAPFEVVIIGGPANLTAAETGALRWFVEERGGVLVLIPDRSPPGRYMSLLGDPPVELRLLEKPVVLKDELQSSELIVATQPPAGSRTLAATAAGDAVVFAARRGAGAVIFSGALDAWRYRAQDDDGFARFWRRVIADETAAVPPPLEVSLEPALVAAGEATRITARLRGSELRSGSDALSLDPVAARAVSAEARLDLPVRLWPTAEPGVYEGEWRPPVAGTFNITVTAGERRGDETLWATDTAGPGSAADPEALALAARTSGGQVFPVEQSTAFVEAMSRAFPARASMRATHIMRSPWWVVPFAGLLCVEWAARRRNGRP